VILPAQQMYLVVICLDSVVRASFVITCKALEQYEGEIRIRKQRFDVDLSAPYISKVS
jgi:hypothetical protein